MAHQRTLSNVEGVSKEPHSISLKVLRLSRPSLSDQYPLPLSSSSISPSAALSYPSTSSSEKFILSPLLTLPPSFGSAYIGETFSCSLCANNELAAQDERFLSAVRIVAEMQTPTQTHVLELSPAESADVALRGVLGFGQSLQKIVRYELKEDGNHVLAVTVAYTERTPIEATTESAPGMVIDVDAPGNQRVRTFRKLYQFNVKQCLLVRTKAGEIQNRSSTKGAKAGEPAPLQYVLEAQLENVGEEPITLEKATLAPKAPFHSTSLWDIPGPGDERRRPPILKPRDVMQVAYFLEQRPFADEVDESSRKDFLREGKVTLGQLSISWAGQMGDRGFLSTGWLTKRKR